ncbi:MAG: VWA domain-containing protein, partial [Bdellovibrionaceae bacterium]|nr:VWA domain-containing protein [Pseudobdellovibrionaceae bacterium]
TGKTYIKTYEEERELTIILAVDISGSADFGTGPYFKGEIMTHLAALLAFSAVKNHDQVGLLLFSDQMEHYVPAKKGRGQVHRILRDLLYYKPKSHETKISVGLSYLQGLLKKRATVFLFSDFMDEGYENALRLLGRKHEVIACVVNDKAEAELPDMGIVELQDAETGEVLTVDTSSASFRIDYQRELKKRKELRDKQLRLAQVERIDIVSGENYIDPLVAFFKRR